MQAGGKLNDIFKVLKKTYQLRVLSPSELTFNNKGEIKIFKGS